MSDGQPGDAKAQANELAVEALKQLLTLASAVLALTITFIKDALGGARDKAVWVFLVPWAWGLLAASIWFAWVAIPDACRRMSKLTAPEYVFAGGRPKVLALIAQFAFLLGLALLAAFAIRNFELFFISQPEAPGPAK